MSSIPIGAFADVVGGAGRHCAGSRSGPRNR